MPKHKTYKSKFTGVRYREHDTRKNGIRKDRYFIIRYKLNKIDKEEALGWETEGYSEKQAFDLVSEIKANIKNGYGFFSLKEKREMELENKEAEIKQKTIEKEKNITIKDFFDNYFVKLHLSNKTIKTKENQESQFKTHINPVIGDKYLNDVSIIDIETIKSNMKEKEYAAASINYVIDIVKNIYNKAIDFEIFDKQNPATKIKSIKKDNKRIRYLTEDEANKLLKELKTIHCLSKEDFAYDYYKDFKTSQLYEMALTSLYCGLRAKELCSINVFDINLKDKIVTIRDPKNTKTRHIPMPNIVYNMFKQRLENISSLEKNSFIFQTTKGKQVREISDQYSRIVENIGLNENIDDTRQKVVFHTLRHTYASWLVQRGVDLYTVQKLMGHSDIKQTMRYAHLAPENYTNAIKVLEG